MNKEKDNQTIYGIRPLEEAIKSNVQFLKIYVQKGQGEGIRTIKQILIKNKLVFTEVPKEKLDQLTQFQNHQGVVAKTTSLSIYNAETLCDELISQNKKPFFIVLDRVTDVRNFGAICRTAHSAGLSGVIVPEKGSAAINQEAIKTSAGALLHLNLCKANNLFQTVKHLKEKGLQIICLTEKANKDLYFVKLTKPCLIIVGNEEEGIHPSLLKLADEFVKIPMHNKMDSLNVSVASAIVMYEVVRQNL